MPPCADLSLRSLHHACLIFHNFKGHQVRHVMIEGEPWFVAADVCTCLGLSLKGGSGQHLKHLDPDQRRTIKKREAANLMTSAHELPHIFGKHDASIAFVTEGGLYRLTFRSDLPEALPFRRWVENEVLPAIRKTGGYLLNEEARETAAADQRDEMPIPQTYPDALRAFADAVERKEAAEKLNAELVRAFAEMADFCRFLRRNSADFRAS